MNNFYAMVVAGLGRRLPVLIDAHAISHTIDAMLHDALLANAMLTAQLIQERGHAPTLKLIQERLPQFDVKRQGADHVAAMADALEGITYLQHVDRLIGQLSLMKEYEAVAIVQTLLANPFQPIGELINQIAKALEITTSWPIISRMQTS